MSPVNSFNGPISLAAMAASQKQVAFFIMTVLSYYCHNVDCKPEQVHLSLADDPFTITVTWSTKEEPEESIVEYGLEGTAEPNKTEGEVQILITGIGPLSRQHIHKVILKSLSPQSTYWYRCGGDKDGWSKYYTFQTFPSGNSWIPRLAIYGDLGSVNGQIVDELTESVQKKEIDVILHAGDIAYDMHLDEGKVGDRFLRMIEPIASRVPYMVAPGNHESFKNFTNYKGRFNMPGDQENMMYSFRLGPVLIIAVSTEVYYFLEHGGHDAILSQYRWLENLLKEANEPENRLQTPWIVVFGHRPMYCSNNVLRGCATGTTKVRTGVRSAGGKGLEKLFYDYGVDLVFWGHQHSYERLWPIYEKFIYNGSTEQPYVNPRAPVHIIAGCAGNKERKHNFLRDLPSWSAFRSTNYGFVRLTARNISHLRLEYVSTEQDGAVIDDVWFVKDKHDTYPNLFPKDQAIIKEHVKSKKIWNIGFD